MTDIVERLRTRNGRADGFGLGPVCDEAADEIELLRALLHDAKADAKAAPAAQGWQPISTAPKDGTEVLLCAPGRLTYGAWSEPSPTPRLKYQDGFAPEEEWEDFDPYWASWDGGFTEADPPTHWMPLPAAPKEPA